MNKIVRLGREYILIWPILLAAVLMVAGNFTWIVLFYIGAAIGLVYGVALVTLARRMVKQAGRVMRTRILIADNHLNYDPVYGDNGEVLVLIPKPQHD